MTDAIAIICTRPDSARLPSKCFLKIAGHDVISHILHRIRDRIKVVLAVPFNQGHLYAQYKSNNVDIFEGHCESPLHRMAEALKWHSTFKKLPKYVVRITHDDMLIDANTMDDLIERVRLENAGYGITPKILEGAGVEVIHSENILDAAHQHKEPIEHISYFVKGLKSVVKKEITLTPRESIKRNYRLTLDYYEDYVVLETILRQLSPFATNDEICAYLDQNSHILKYNKLPVVSVYTCARNAEKYITNTMLSVFNFDDVEYVVVDDKSTDNTLNEIMAFSSYKEKFRLLVNEKNKGLASSSNDIFKYLRGKYIMRIDADDKLAYDALPKMVEHLNLTGSGIVYSAYKEINSEAKVIKEYCDPRENHHAGCALMDKRMISEIKFTDGLRHWDSLDLYVKIKDRYPISYIDEPLWFYRRHNASLTNQSTRPSFENRYAESTTTN